MKKTLLALGLLVFLGYGAWVVVYNVGYTKPTPIVIAPLAQVIKTRPVSAELLTYVNQERANNGLPALIEDARLDASAAAKCADMVAGNYWAHSRPDGTEPWHFIVDAGVSYRTAGENLAYGYSNASDVTQGWMHSPEHRENILKPFNAVGYAVCHSDNFIGGGAEDIVVQHFATE